MKKILLVGIYSLIVVMIVGCGFAGEIEGERKPLVEVMENGSEEELMVQGTMDLEDELKDDKISYAEEELNENIDELTGDDSESANQVIKESNDDLMNIQLNQESQLIVEMDAEGYLMTITFGFSGHNDIFSFEHFNYMMKDETVVDVPVSSDFIGPYIMRNLKVSDEGLSQQFTGGWHGQEPDGTGEPTAECIDVLIEADGVEINDIKDYLVANVKITVINEINPYNDFKPCLEEKVVYKIVNGHIDVTVTQKAIEDMEILRYYGLQTQNRVWAGTVEYVTESGELIKSSTIESSYGFIKKYGQTRKYTVTSEDSLREITVGLKNTGLGDYEYLGESQSTCFTLNYGKSYFNVINEKALVLNQGESVFIEGYYHFFD